MSEHPWFKVEAAIPLLGQMFKIRVYQDPATRLEHVVLICGDIHDDSTPILVRVHSECLTGDVFGSQRCDCGQQLNDSLELIAGERRGVLIYLRQEGRGIGLVEKLKAYNLQDNDDLDTVEANVALGHPADARDFGIAAEILSDLNAHSIRLITNNPEKITTLEANNVRIVERVSLRPRLTKFNSSYLDTKHKHFRHLIDLSVRP